MAIIVLFKQGTADTSQQINYDGYNLPRDAKSFVPIPIDATNNPKLFIANQETPQAVTLPDDTMILIPGEKEIVETKILDGVSVTERISREACKIEIDFVLRSKDSTGTTYTGGVFPQKLLEQLWSNLFLPDTVVKVQNTQLNGLGISELVIKSVTPTTQRGSTNIHVKIKAIENVPGQSLNM